VDGVDAEFNPVTLMDAFIDVAIPAGFAPFNIQSIGTNLFVTYAKQDANKEDDVPGPGNGYVDIFDTSGNLMKRFASNGALDSPWGLALAPTGFGQLTNVIDGMTYINIHTTNNPGGEIRGQVIFQ